MAKDDSDKKARNTIEWVIASLGMVVLALALGFILYQAINKDSGPPRLSVSVESIERSGNGYRVDFIVTNTGPETAASVVIEGELSKGGQSMETSTATLAYAPANSIRRGGIYFTHDPDQHELKIRAAGFEKP
jgi:uncharacterized protein (TIGR02588 family)